MLSQLGAGRSPARSYPSPPPALRRAVRLFRVPRARKAEQMIDLIIGARISAGSRWAAYCRTKARVAYSGHSEYPRTVEGGRHHTRTPPRRGQAD